MNSPETQVSPPLENYLDAELSSNSCWSELCSEADAYFLSTRPTWRRYERDLMQQIKDKEMGAHRIAVGYRLAEFDGLFDQGVKIPTRNGGIADKLRPPLDVLLPQVIALKVSLALRLNPDNPSRRGAISRVVQGVTIHGA